MIMFYRYKLVNQLKIVFVINTGNTAKVVEIEIWCVLKKRSYIEQRITFNNETIFFYLGNSMYQQLDTSLTRQAF